MKQLIKYSFAIIAMLIYTACNESNEPMPESEPILSETIIGKWYLAEKWYLNEDTTILNSLQEITTFSEDKIFDLSFEGVSYINGTYTVSDSDSTINVTAPPDPIGTLEIVEFNQDFFVREYVPGREGILFHKFRRLE